MDAIPYVGKFVRETIINVGVDMHVVTVLDLEQFAQALVDHNPDDPSLEVCTEYFLSVSIDQFGALFSLLKSLVPDFTAECFRDYLYSAILPETHPSYVDFFKDN